MKINAPVKYIQKRLKEDGLIVSTEVIDKCLEYFEDDIINKLSKGEVVKIREVGKITPSVHYLKSNLTKQDYATIKFKFAPFGRIKQNAKSLLSKAEEKVVSREIQESGD